MVINFVILSNNVILCYSCTFTLRNLYSTRIEEFPEQNPIDSGTILQTIQRIDYLVRLYDCIYTLLLKSTLRHTCYCKVCAHERSLEGLQLSQIAFL